MYDLINVKEVQNNMAITNYEYLKKTGQLNYNSIVVDTNELKDGITWQWYLNSWKPKNEKSKALKMQYLEQFANVQHTRKEIEKKSKLKKSVLDRVDLMSFPLYISILPHDVSLGQKCLDRKIKKILNDLGIKYCLVSDYGEHERLHWHGFIDIEKIADYFALDMSLNNEYFQFGYAKKRKTRLFFGFKPLLSVGFCNVSKPDNITYSINYIVKYISKDIKSQNLEHKLLASRWTKEEKETIQTKKNLKNQKIIDNLIDRFGIIVSVKNN